MNSKEMNREHVPYVILALASFNSVYNYSTNRKPSEVTYDHQELDMAGLLRVLLVAAIYSVSLCDRGWKI
jgi:hypothetical protein